MKRFNVRQIEAFRAVISLGSMTKASESLGISQPAVSRLMTDFQEAVGFKLFRRSRNGAEPTADARRLFELVDKFFVGLEEMNDEVQAIRTVKSGSVAIAAMGPYDYGIIPELAAQFRRTHPGISLKLESQPQDRVADWVASRRADIGILTLPVLNSSVATRELLTMPALCVMPTGHALAEKNEIQPEDLNGESFVGFPRGTPFRFETDSLFDKRGIERQMMTEASTHEAVCNLVAAGLGVSIVSPFSPHFRRNPRLVFRPFKPALPITLGVVADEETLSVAAKAFFDFLLERTQDYGENLKSAGGRSPS
ncbi:LysR family transcriptional regulator [Tropicimonas isoalkanivorans]|uniref:DNA-binding transcriptional regulator, LysR family n=1 Tax=Tropicimonas isoalkanivorans TaxID=441112 RepID=A0A1I1KPF8_9RHOB|nr:LysR family transcriptional regulator [Tropicimonas isoalkanivorans]SFC62485.1 DNA-binding transcriptional regulator, LysR family [Tropicimonas isoalkanivorans]